MYEDSIDISPYMIQEEERTSDELFMQIMTTHVDAPCRDLVQQLVELLEIQSVKYLYCKDSVMYAYCEILRHVCVFNLVLTADVLLPHILNRKNIGSMYPHLDGIFTTMRFARDNASFHVFRSFCRHIARVVLCEECLDWESEDRTIAQLCEGIRGDVDVWHSSMVQNNNLTMLGMEIQKRMQKCIAGGCACAMVEITNNDEDDMKPANEQNMLSLMKYCCEIANHVSADVRHLLLQNVRCVECNPYTNDAYLLSHIPSCLEYYLTLQPPFPYDKNALMKGAMNTCDTELVSIALRAYEDTGACNKSHLFHFASFPASKQYPFAYKKLKKWRNKYGTDVNDNPVIHMWNLLLTHCTEEVTKDDLKEMMFQSGIFGNVMMYAHLRQTLIGEGVFSEKSCDTWIIQRCGTLRDVKEEKLGERYFMCDLEMETFGSVTCNLQPYRDFIFFHNVTFGMMNEKTDQDWIEFVGDYKYQSILYRQACVHLHARHLPSPLQKYINTFI